MGKPPEEIKDPETELPEQKATQPETVPPANAHNSLPRYYNLEEITSVGPDLTDTKVACNGMPFASTYLGFWEMHRAFFESMSAGALEGGNTKQMVVAVKERAKTRFIDGYASTPRMTPEELDDMRNFFGFIFQTGFTHGITLFTEWLNTPDGKRELTRRAAPMMLRALIGSLKKHEEPHPEA